MAVSTCASEGVCGSLTFPTALALTIVFGVLLVVHTGQAIYYGKPYTYPLLTSTIWSFLAFLLLALSHSYPHPLLPLLSHNLLLISLLWLTTYLHLLLPHLTNHFLPTRTLCSLRAPVLRVLSLLFTLPVAVLQVVGVLSGVENHGNGRVVFAAGVILQGFGILIFIYMLSVLDREVRELESGGVLEIGKRGWRRGVWTGYVNAGLVLIILISRLLRLLSPNTIPSKQLIYTLEVIPLLLATLSWNILHPGRILAGEEKMESLGEKEFKYTRGEAVDTEEEEDRAGARIPIGVLMGIPIGIGQDLGLVKNCPN